MPKFFVENISGDTAYIVGEDAKHIARVLRMEPGKTLVVSDTQGTDYTCRIVGLTADIVTLHILEAYPCECESPIPLRLYQAMPKGDKLEVIVQKAVELGAVEIVPVLTSRCISRPSIKAADKKMERLRRIAYEAAKQSGRGIIPQVSSQVTFEEAIDQMIGWDLPILLYEREATPLGEVLRQKPAPKSIAVMVGSEGGFSQSEADYAVEKGVQAAGLGRRILRCETAPICALSILMYHLGEF